MKKYIVFIIAVFSPIALAEIKTNASVFSSSSGVGTTFAAEYEHNRILLRGDLSIANDIGGTSFAIGYKAANDLKFFLGSSLQVSGERHQTTIDINGVGVSASDTGSGSATFAEIEYKNFYIRHNIYDIDYEFSASRQTGVDVGGNPVYGYGTASSNRSDSTTWVGYRFNF